MSGKEMMKDQERGKGREERGREVVRKNTLQLRTEEM